VRFSHFDYYQRGDAGDDKARQQDGEQDAHFFAGVGRVAGAGTIPFLNPVS
jgi:hypothetical protein